jgi:hypothetical protein
MTLDPWSVSFPSDDARTDAPLGGYYQDFTAALGLVAGGTHGPLDAEGRPTSSYGAPPGQYNPIVIAQYGLACVPGARAGHEALRQRLRGQADWLVARQEKHGAARGFWVQRFDNPKYPALRAPWVSALAQGNALSLLLRAAEIFGDETYAGAAHLAFPALCRPVSAGGVLWESREDLWLEEYPLEPAGHVLNGAVYALWGALDFARVTGREDAWRLWRAGAATVARHLQAFDTGFWSRYELATSELVSVHYHKNIHIPQLEVMHRLTGERVFQDTAIRWRRYLASPVSWIRRKAEGRWRWRKSRQLPRRATPGLAGEAAGA